jgi:hypothetical protein
MTATEMTNSLFDAMVSNLTLGVIPDVQTAIAACLVCFVGYAAVDIIWGATIKQWWNKLEDRKLYDEYEKKRERAEKFRNLYSARHDSVGPEYDSFNTRTRRGYRP